MSSFVIKLIAISCMFIDHIGAIFLESPLWFRFIGRISFPLFAFFISQGCKYSKNKLIYLKRLFLLAIISEIPFDLAFIGDINFLNKTNTVYTLFLGALTIVIFEHIKIIKINFIFKALLFLIPMFISELLMSDYGVLGIILIFLFYISNNKKSQILLLLVWDILKYKEFFKNFIILILNYWINLENVFNSNISAIYMKYTLYFIFSFLPFIFILFYNGKRGFNLKWTFYIFYPVHLILLTIIYYSLNT